MSCGLYKVGVKLKRCISDASDSSIVKCLTQLNNVFLDVQPYLEHAEFLRSQTSGKQELLKWISSVRKLSNDTENILDIYCYFQSSDGKSRLFSSTTLTSSYRCSQIASFPNRLSFIVWGKFLISFSKKVVEFYVPKILEKAVELDLYQNTHISNPSSMDGRTKQIEVDTLIGRDKEFRAIKDLITRRNSKNHVEIVAVEGVAGIGKTAIAKAVFNDVKGKFDCHAWVVFSHRNTTAVNFLKDVVKGLFDSLSFIVPRNLEDITFEAPLQETICRCLSGKNFLLVIDDISSHQEISHKFLLDLFPLDSKVKILFTTRRMDFPKESNHIIYKIKRLERQDSLELLCKSSNMKPKLWPSVKSIAVKITKMCQYVPLSIKVIGGLLSTKNEVSEWSIIQERLSKSDLFPLCYAGMPPSLRTCFLYSSLFADQVEFSYKRLQRIWIAEGLIEPEPNLSLEDTAKLRMDDLIQRNFLQVVRVGMDGETKTCSLLRPIWEFAIQHCFEDRLNAIVGRKTNSLSTFDIASLLLTFYLSEIILNGCSQITSLILSRKFLLCSRNKVRGRSSNLGRSREFDRLIKQDKEIEASKNSLTHMNSTKKREITALDLNGYNYNQILRSCSTGFKPLAFLELSHLPITSLPDMFGNLVLLKYLGLRGTKVKTLPKSIGKLRKLQTLDIRESMILETPKEIETLTRIRHLLLSGSFTDKVVSLTFNIDHFSDIKTLAGVKLSSEIAKRLRLLSQVRKLSVGEVSHELSKDLLESVYKMVCLQSLTIKCAIGDIFHIQETQNSPPSLQKLRLGGQVQGLDHWKTKLNSLKYLYLWDTQLQEDPFKILKHLKNIMVLSLCNVYNGESIQVEEGDFPKLKKLSIICFDGLKEWGEIKKGVLESLEELTFSNCSKLQAIPMGLENLSRLKILHCTNMPISFVQKVNVLYGRENKTLFKANANGIEDDKSRSADKEMNERTNTQISFPLSATSLKHKHPVESK